MRFSRYARSLSWLARRHESLDKADPTTTLSATALRRAGATRLHTVLGLFRAPQNISLRAYLFILSLCTAIPLTVFGGGLIFHFAHDERENMERGLHDTTRALATALDRDFQLSVAALNVLAASSLLDEGKLREFYALCERVRASQPGWHTIILLEASGTPLLHLALPYGAKISSIAETESFEKVLQTKQPAIIPLMKDPTSGWVYGVRVPVLRGGEVKYVLTAAMAPGVVADILTRQKLPTSWLGIIHDQKLHLVARTRSPEKFIGQQAAMIRDAGPQAAEGSLKGLNREGVLSYSFFRKAPLSGWYVVLNVPADLLDHPVTRGIATMIGLGLGAVALGLIFALAMSRRINASIAAVAASAQRLGLKQEIGEVPKSAVAELNRISEAHQQALKLLQESDAKHLKAEEDLRKANEALEQGVAERTAELSTEIQKKQALENSLRSQAQLLQLTHDAIIVRSIEDAKIQFWNKGATQLYGWSPDEAVGEGVHNLLRCRCAQPLKEIHDKLFREDHWEGEVFHTRRDGTELILESRWSVQRDADGVPISILEVNSDVTCRKYAEQKLQENEWLARVGTMTSIFAHEIANPLNSISTSMELVESDLAAAAEVHPRVKKTLEISAREIQRVSALLREFRAFARPQAAKLKATDPVELLRDVLVPQVAVCQTVGITIQREFGDLPRIAVDPDKIKQVILNLCKNAIEAMPDGGTLTVRTRREKDTAILEISDTGAGIAEDIDAFQLFKTTKPNGSGLGLPVVRQIIAAHRGSVEYTSAAGRGTTFRVCLPISSAIGWRSGGQSGGADPLAGRVVGAQEAGAEPLAGEEAGKTAQTPPVLSQA